MNIGDIELPGFKNTPEYLRNLKSVVNAEENPVKYLACDPGEHCGVSGYDERYHLVFLLNVPSKDINLFLHQFENIDTCIIEDFRLYPNKAKEQAYSKMETTRVIGRFESWAEVKEVTLVSQMATIKNTAYAWLGKKPPTVKKKQNPMDAHAHFTYWAVRNKKLKMEVNLETREVTFVDYSTDTGV